VDTLTRGTIKKGVSTNHYYFWIEESGAGLKLFGHPKNCDLPNGHHCVLSPGVEVEFRIVPSDTHPGKFRAIDIKLVDPPTLDEFEESTVTIWHQSHGFAVRSCGCPIFLARRHFLTKSEYVDLIEAGDTIRHRVIMDEDPRDPGTLKPIAVEIDLYVRSEKV
jgi:hypothetical protein